MGKLTNICEATSQSQDFVNFRSTNRKGKKLLAEKKRRARINNCLIQIRQLICGDQQETDTDLDKMEKAEILEKTLDVLTRFRHGSIDNNLINTQKAMAIRYASGFSSCAEELMRYIKNCCLVPTDVKVQLQNFLREIVHKMETLMLGDNRCFSSAQLISSSLSSVSSEGSAAVRMLREDVNGSLEVEGVPDPLARNISEIGSSCIVSPIHYSTPVAQKHQFLDTSRTLIKQELTNYSSNPDVVKNNNPSIISTETYFGHTTDVNLQLNSLNQHTSSSDESVYQYPDVCWPESSLVKENHYLHSSKSSFSQSDSSLCDKSSLGSPLTHTALTLPVYNNHGNQYYPTTSGTIVQSKQFKSTPPLDPVVKQIKAPISLLDLCYKKTQQGPADAMWRPW